MAACIYPSKNIATPAMAEAWACLHAVKFGEDLGFRDNCVKGDSLIVIKGINDAKDDKSHINNVLKADDTTNNRNTGWRKLQLLWWSGLKESEQGMRRGVR
ncbi:hypothetical protein Goklo_016557, partial [Gossypium klotzschianum]|nr:hypothetical protein [Gossypium klotzschianum]